MKLGYIYKIESPTGKVYIGQTVCPKSRFQNYRGLHCKGQRLLYNSFIKHGVENHSFDIIAEVDGVFIDFWEQHYIRQYNSYREFNPVKGMNLTFGGDSMRGLVQSKKTREKLSKIKKAQGYTPNMRRHMEAKRGTKLPKNPKWIKNNSEARKKKIYQYDMNGKFLKEWKSAMDVQLELGLSRKNISNNLRLKSHHAFNYVWSYEYKEKITPTKKKIRWDRKIK